MNPSETHGVGKIALVGAGAVGGYYGGCLARAGADICFLARASYAAWRENGLRVRSVAGDFAINPVQVFASPEEIGPVDWVIVALKSTANAHLAELVTPLLQTKTRILTLQNGLGNDAQLARLFGADRIYGGLCFVCINRDAQGVVHHLGQGHVSLGKFTQAGPGAMVGTAGQADDPALAAMVALFQAAGISAKAVPVLAAAQWRKLVWNIPFNGLSIALGGLDCAQILASEEGENRVRLLMREVIHTAGCLGYSMPEELTEQQIEATRTMGPYRPSSMIDYLHGLPVELDAIWGEPLRQAQLAGLLMPELAQLHAELLEKLAGA